jgi:hypothetical protein
MVFGRWRKKRNGDEMNGTIEKIKINLKIHLWKQILPFLRLMREKS